MKLFTFVLLTATSVCTVNAQSSSDDTIETVRTKQLEMRNSADSSQWFIEKMEYDLNSDPETIVMKQGVFNYPKYSLLHPFRGLGAGGRATIAMPINYHGKHIVYSYFTMNKTELYPSITSDNQIFFALITVTDVDAPNYKAPQNIFSRNHPDYLGEGYIRSGDTLIDYMTLTTIDNGNFAIVNKRIFDLSHGVFILIAPQKDGTFRSLQLKEAPQVINHDATSFDDFTFDVFIREDLLKRENIKEFFTNDHVKF